MCVTAEYSIANKNDVNIYNAGDKYNCMFF